MDYDSSEKNMQLYVVLYSKRRLLKIAKSPVLRTGGSDN